VVIFLPSAAATGRMHDRVAAPSTWTVHAPHWAMPQPYLVPVRPTCSRKAQSRGVSPSTFTSTAFPFTFSLATFVLLLESARGPTRRATTFLSRIFDGRLWQDDSLRKGIPFTSARARIFALTRRATLFRAAAIVQCTWKR